MNELILGFTIERTVPFSGALHYRYLTALCAVLTVSKEGAGREGRGGGGGGARTGEVHSRRASTIPSVLSCGQAEQTAGHVLQDCRNLHWLMRTCGQRQQHCTAVGRPRLAGMLRPSLAEGGLVARDNSIAELLAGHILRDCRNPHQLRKAMLTMQQHCRASCRGPEATCTTSCT